MTIYLTPYDPQTLQATGPSTDSGCPSLEMALLLFGAGFIDRGVRFINYPGVFVSDYVLRLEP